MIKQKLQFCLIFLCICNLLPAQEVSTNNWYVGNTRPGDWIKYKQVWLSAGQYRFTANAVAKDGNRSMHLEINGATVKTGAPVPANAENRFELLHLGYKNLAEGYYDIKLVFETGNVNCDNLFIKKSNLTSSNVLASDTMFRINRNDGPHIFAIGGVISASSLLAKAGERNDNSSWYPGYSRDNTPYTRKQMLTWYKQEFYAYTPEITDRALDFYVSEMVEAKVDVIYAHGRGDTDFQNDVEDRAYNKGIGGYGCRMLPKLAEAINRSAYARNNMKIAYFFDNAAVVSAYNDAHKSQGRKFDWGEEECQEFMWKQSIKPWIENVPREMMFLTPDNKLPIQFWSANANYDYNNQSNRIVEFFTYLKNKMLETFQLEPAFILSKDFFTRDSRVNNAIAWGVQGWFAWNNLDNRIAMESFDGKKFGFAFNGGRMPMPECRGNDWDPETNTGSWPNPAKMQDFHVSALNADGSIKIRPVFEQAIAENAEWVVLESWSDWAEGSTWYRSDHSEYLYPNQHLAMVREFADRDSESILLEAEACDEYYTQSPGNRGGAYRVNWYNDLDKDFWSSDKEINLSIYRPLHKLGALVFQGKPSTYRDYPVRDFAAGQKDVWAFIDGGMTYAHEIDGRPANRWTLPVGHSENLKKLALGGGYAWGLTADNRVLRTELPQGATNSLSGWRDITRNVSPIKDIDISLKDAWAIDAEGNVYYSDLHGSFPWKPVPGKLTSICADDQCAWGLAMDSNELLRISSEKRDHWDTVPNPYRLTKLSAAAGEIWGVNSENKIYRKDSSPDGEWQFVAEGYTNMAVGLEYVWLQDVEGNFYNCKISGFETASVFSVHDPFTGIHPVNLALESVRINPVKFDDYVLVGIESRSSMDAEFKIYNMNGYLIRSETTVLQPGSNETVIDRLATLSRGVYVLNISTADGQRSFKIIK
jgi:hypothetical protein